MHGLCRIAAGWMLWAMCLAQASNPHFGRGVWRGNIVDYRIVNGWAIVEGDVIAGRAEELAARYRALLTAGTIEVKEKLRQSIIVSDQARLWPDGVVPYEVDPVITDTTQIDAAVRHWNQRTGVRLVARNGEPNYFRLTPYEDPTACASSSVGMRGGMQLLYASETCGANILIHEIGHVVGLFHEQARSDRDRYVRVLWENLTKPGLSQYGASAPSVDFGAYDYYSIMHYAAGDFSKNGSLTMETRPAGIPMGQILALSDGDIDAVNRMYGKVPQTVTVSSTPPGIQVIVDGEAVTAPKTFDWTAGSVHVIEAPAVQSDANGRYEFARWSDNGERAHEISVATEKTTLYTANFIRYNKLNLRVVPEDGGSIRLSPDSPDGHYRDGTRVVFTAVPGPGYVFANWDGPLIEHNINLTNLPANPVSFLVDADFQGFTARFVPGASDGTGSATGPVTRFLSNLSTGGSTTAPIRVDGKLYNTPVGFTWEPGTTHDVDISGGFPVTGDLSMRTFRSWNDDGERVRKIVAGAGPATYIATYGIQYALFPATVGPGTVDSSPLSESWFFDVGTNVYLKATPADGNQFVGWGRDLGGTANPRTIVVNESLQPIAFFGSSASVSPFAVTSAARQRPTVEIMGNSIRASISPGEAITIHMQGIGPDTPSDAVPDPLGAIATRLADTRVLVSGVAVPVLSASRGHVTAFVPYGASVLVGSAVRIQVQYQEMTTGSGVVAMIAATPAIYTTDGSGSGLAHVINENGNENGPDNRAPKGSLITFFAGGLGVTSPSASDYQVSTDPGPPPKGELEVRIGGAVAEIVTAAVEPGRLGIHRIQARVPENARTGPASPLILTVDGAPSQFDVTIAVE